jgi:cytochrome c
MLRARIHVRLATLMASLFVSIRAVTGVEVIEKTASEGHRLAEAWCKSCHAIEPDITGTLNQTPSFEAIANRHGTTALSLKVFLRTSHQNMPNLVFTPDQADALANYILSLRSD